MDYIGIPVYCQVIVWHVQNVEIGKIDLTAEGAYAIMTDA